VYDFAKTIFVIAVITSVVCTAAYIRTAAQAAVSIDTAYTVVISASASGTSVDDVGDMFSAR
jgi:hypothetical protein